MAGHSNREPIVRRERVHGPSARTHVHPQRMRATVRGVVGERTGRRAGPGLAAASARPARRAVQDAGRPRAGDTQNVSLYCSVLYYPHLLPTTIFEIHRVIIYVGILFAIQLSIYNLIQNSM